MSAIAITDLLADVSDQYDKYLELSQLRSLADIASATDCSSEVKIAPTGFTLIGK